MSTEYAFEKRATILEALLAAGLLGTSAVAADSAFNKGQGAQQLINLLRQAGGGNLSFLNDFTPEGRFDNLVAKLTPEAKKQVQLFDARNTLKADFKDKKEVTEAILKNYDPLASTKGNLALGGLGAMVVGAGGKMGANKALTMAGKATPNSVKAKLLARLGRTALPAATFTSKRVVPGLSALWGGAEGYTLGKKFDDTWSAMRIPTWKQISSSDATGKEKMKLQLAKLVAHAGKIPTNLSGGHAGKITGTAAGGFLGIAPFASLATPAAKAVTGVKGAPAFLSSIWKGTKNVGRNWIAPMVPYSANAYNEKRYMDPFYNMTNQAQKAFNKAESDYVAQDELIKKIVSDYQKM